MPTHTHPSHPSGHGRMAPLWLVLAGALLQAVACDPPADAQSALPVGTVETVATFTPGEFVESVAIDPDGVAYVTILGDPATARIERVAADGSHAPLRMLPDVGTVALDRHGALWATVGLGAESSDGKAIWRLSPETGEGGPVAALPPDASPNGIALDFADNVYVADSTLGTIWRLPAGSAAAEPWLVDPLLAPDPGVPFPGANGIKVFAERSVFVANSSTSRIVRVPIEPDGRAGAPVVHAEGVPTDDFALDEEGNLYATTHPFNTVVRVAPDGAQAVVVDAADGVVGPTAAVFGRDDDATGLYVVTDGGVFGLQVKVDPNQPAELLPPALLRVELGIAGASIP